MKLKNKLLTVLPLTTICVATPIAISGCSCSDSFTLKFGESINCRNDQKDNKTVKYHTIDAVKNACSSHIQPVEDIKLTDANLEGFKFESYKEYYYWDLAYSYASNNIEFMLTWMSGDTQTAKINDEEFTGLKYKFNGENKVVICTQAGKELVKSHCFDKVQKA